MKERLIRVCARGEIALNVRNLEYLQRITGEDEDTAWRRMRPRLGTGKHLDETFIMSPQAVPHTGIAPTPTADGGAGASPPIPTGDGAAGPGGAGPQLPPTSVFGGEKKLRPCASPATSPLNLLGRIESWGIGVGTGIRDLALKVPALTGAQLNELLKRLPDGITYELTLNKEEEKRDE